MAASMAALAEETLAASMAVEKLEVATDQAPARVRG